MSFIDFWAHICNLTRANLSTPSGDADQEQSNSTHQSEMIQYFNNNCYDLMESIILYFRKQLKVPDYTQIFEDTEEFKQEDFDKETEQIFNDNPHLLPKLEKMKHQIIQKIFDIIDSEDSKVKVSLLVYSNFKKLVKADIRTEFRGLELLRQQKSSFVPVQN